MRASLSYVLANEEKRDKIWGALIRIETNIWYERVLTVWLCALLCRWGVDEELLFLTIAFDVHFLLADQQGVQLLNMLLLHALCYVSFGMANVL